MQIFAMKDPEHSFSDITEEYAELTDKQYEQADKLLSKYTDGECVCFDIDLDNNTIELSSGSLAAVKKSDTTSASK